VTRTCLAAAVPIADANVLNPCLQELGLVLLNETRQSVDLARSEPEIGRYANRSQPEFRQLAFPRHVYLRRLGSVAREEEEPIRTALKKRSDSRGLILPVFPLLHHSVVAPLT
jgi:hypothetical protein